MSRFRLDGKVAVVTGGASGIGQAICRAYAEQGARLAVADLNEDAGLKLADELGGVFSRTDVTQMPSVEAAGAHAVEEFGRIDVWVNSAGIGFVGNVQETPEDEWQRLFDVNVTGVYHGCRVAVDHMLAQEPPGGAILNLGSVAGLVAIARRFAYCATKGAVIALTRELAMDYVRQGIRCNAICPGTIYTPFVQGYLQRFHADTLEQTTQELHARQPLGRMGRPEEVASMAVYLASDEAVFVTGAALTIDGGLTAQ